MSGQNTEDNATARAIAELQESMRLMREEMEVMKTSGVTRAGNDPLQQLGASENAMNPGSSGYRSGEAQRKRGRETDYHDEDKDKGKIEKRMITTLQKMKARHCFRCLKQGMPS